MRAVALALLLPAGCIGYGSLDADWRRGQQPAADANAATAAAGSVHMEWRTLGTSVQGRPLRALTVGHGPRRVLWIGGIHGDEREGSTATRDLPDAFAGVPGAVSTVTLTIVEDVNPDGTAAKTRTNANGVDLNRNYPAKNFVSGSSYGSHPLDQPESKLLHDLIDAEQPHLVIVAHAWRGDHFINFDGPAQRLAELFATKSGYRVKPSDKIAPTPGSLGSWVGRTLGVPILTLEYERGTDPLTAWLDTRAAILAVVMADR